jgi:hypothetical protein
MGGAAIANSTGEASGNDYSVTSTANSHGGIVTSVVAVGKAGNNGGTTPVNTEAGAAAGVAAPADTFSAFQSAAYGTALPTSTSSLLSASTVVAQAFASPDATIFGVVNLADKSLPGTVEGEGYDANVSFTLNTSSLGGPQALDIGFIGGAGTTSSGFEEIILTIKVNGTAQASADYTGTMAGLQSFFDNQVVSLGSLPISSALTVDFDLALYSTGGGDNFDGELVFGDPIPEPSAWPLLAIATPALLAAYRARTRKAPSPRTSAP